MFEIISNVTTFLWHRCHWTPMGVLLSFSKHITLTWAPIPLYDFFFPFHKATLRRKQGNAAFLNIGDALSYICDSTKTANNKWYLLSDFCIPGIISHALYVVCHVTFKIILWGMCYYFYSYLQVWKLRFRRERKLPQCHVASNWGLGPKTGRHCCLRLFSLSQTQWFFLLRVSRCYLGSHVPGLRMCPNWFGHFWQSFYPLSLMKDSAMTPEVYKRKFALVPLGNIFSL